MKAKEIRELGQDEIEQRVREEEEQLQHLRFQHSIASLPNPMVLRQKRRELARLKTLLAEKQQTA